MKSLSHVWLFATLWTVGWQAPMSSSERPLRGPSSDISRQGSGGMSAQTWSFSSFSFCPVWSPTLEVGTQFFVLNQPWTVWLQLGLRTLFSQSTLQSVHKLLQSTYSVPGIGATEQKYTHDPGKPIFCSWVTNSDSAECRHQMLHSNVFF